MARERERESGVNYTTRTWKGDISVKNKNKTMGTRERNIKNGFTDKIEEWWEWDKLGILTTLSVRTTV